MQKPGCVLGRSWDGTTPSPLTDSAPAGTNAATVPALFLQNYYEPKIEYFPRTLEFFHTGMGVQNQWKRYHHHVRALHCIRTVIEPWRALCDGGLCRRQFALFL